MLIYLIDAQPLPREAPAALLRRLYPGATVALLGAPGDAPDALAQHGTPDAIILALPLAAREEGDAFAAVQRLHALFPHAALMVASTQPAAQVQAAFVQAGASTYVEKTADVDAVGAAFQDLLGHIPQEQKAHPLSQRQQQLLAMLDEGLGNRDIAQRLGLSEHTIKAYMWRLFKRLGVGSRTQALRAARAAGLLE